MGKCQPCNELKHMTDFICLKPNSTGFLLKAQTKNPKKASFRKNLSPPLFFKQSSSIFYRKSIIKT